MSSRDYPDFMTSIKTSHTFNEAIELIKLRNKTPTPMRQISWVNTKTGKPVVIGQSNI